jgi:hypothetical protein
MNKPDYTHTHTHVCKRKEQERKKEGDKRKGVNKRTFSLRQLRGSAVPKVFFKQPTKFNFPGGLVKRLISVNL